MASSEDDFIAYWIVKSIYMEKNIFIVKENDA